MKTIVSQDSTGAVRRIRMGLASRQALIAYIFLFPAFIFFTVFYFVPIVIEFWTSLHQDDNSNVLVGLDHYFQAFGDERAVNSFITTLLFAVTVTILSMALGLFLAIMLNQAIWGRSLIRTI